LDDRLASQQKKGQGLWVVGNKYTIADLACFSWVNWAEWAGVPLEKFSNVQKWLDVISERPAVKTGVDIPEKFEMKEAMKTKEGEEKYTKYHSNWVMQGHDEEKKKH
jgi:glutathione S-transferase